MMRASAIALGLFLVPLIVHAGDDRTVTAGAMVSASNMESHTDLAVSGTIGYRVSRILTVEMEATFVPRIRSEFPNDRVTIQSAATSIAASPFILIYPPPVFSNPGGRLVLFSNNARFEIPTTTTRVTPYFVAGGGVGNLRRTADYTYRILPLDVVPAAGSLGVNSPIATRPISAPVTSSSTNLALTLGGGLSVDVAAHLSIEGDVRLVRLFGDTDRNIGRFGVGVRSRF